MLDVPVVVTFENTSIQIPLPLIITLLHSADERINNLFEQPSRLVMFTYWGLYSNATSEYYLKKTHIDM